MRPFSSIRVLVEYRNAGSGVPQNRLLRARVCQTVTARGAACCAFGDELIGPRALTDREMHAVHAICLAQLSGLARRVIFTYDPLLGLEPEEYPADGRAAA